MFSAMGEYVRFQTEVSPFKEGGEVRNVEEWLTDVETQMRDSLRALVKRASGEYSRQDRPNWIFAWPSQIVLTLD